MFGHKLKTWMENYIGRAKKKDVQKEKPKRSERRSVILESSESLAYSDTGISSSSQQVLSSSAIDARDKYSTATVGSEKSVMTHIHTVISLPSPESAYSTGYSTDGASPGPTGAPEYYINIRTGKHYFPSPAPTPTSSQPENVFLQLHSRKQCLPTSLFPEDSSLPMRLSRFSCTERELSSSSSSSSCAKPRAQGSSRFSNCFLPPTESFVSEVPDSTSGQDARFSHTADHFEIFGYSKFFNKKSSSAKSQLTPLKFFLRSPKNEREKPKVGVNKTPTLESKKALISSGKHRKWFKQPFQKFGNRRTGCSDERGVETDSKKEKHFEKNFGYLLGSETSASPRQRNRIKTNPWLPTEPLSSLHNLNFSPSLPRNRSCSNTPLQNRRTIHSDLLQNLQLKSKCVESVDYLDGLKKAVSCHKSGKPVIELSDRSEEDLTLNEVMGTYNESYVYEKETDILSDSDPTDCEDYGTDSEANNGGDEQDSHDDELDFIDNASVIEIEDSFSRNTGKCNYYDSHNKKSSFLLKNDRHLSRKSSECRKNSRKNLDFKARPLREKRRQSKKFFKREDEDMKVKKTSDENMVQKIEIEENSESVSFNKVLAHKMMAKKVSKSAEGSPVTRRRQILARESQELHIRDKKSKAEVEGKEIQSGTLVNLILGDLEADMKYKELIKEAENIFESLRNSPVIKIKKDINILSDEDKTLERVKSNTITTVSQKNTETTFRSHGKPKEFKTPAKKIPTDLGLKLFVETPKKLKRLDFETKNQSSFKAKCSAHSPLDPLGPTLRSFSIFKPAAVDEGKISTSSSEDPECGKVHGVKKWERKWQAVTGSHMVPIAFQSVDLGKSFTSYCPQSEPVKRKIYTCSKTYDKLVKQFESKSPTFEENINGNVGHVSLVTHRRKLITSPKLEKYMHGNEGSCSRGGENNGDKSTHEETFHLRTSSDLGNSSRAQITQILRCSTPIFSDERLLF